MDIVDENQQLRPLQCELNILTRSDGSALVAQGDTAVLVSVYGPVEVKPQRLLIDKASVEALFRPKVGLPCVSDRQRAFELTNTCEVALLSTLHPRTAVNIILQEMQDSGGLLACSVNAACMALINSGISMKFLVGAVGCMIDQLGNIILDPTSKQLKDSKCSFTFVFDSKERNLVTSHTTGCFTKSEFKECLLLCQRASAKIFIFYRETVTKCARRS